MVSNHRWAPPSATGLILEVPAMELFKPELSWTALEISLPSGGTMSPMMERLRLGPVEISVIESTEDRCLLRFQRSKVVADSVRLNLFVSNVGWQDKSVVIVPDAPPRSLRNGPRLERIFVYLGFLRG